MTERIPTTAADRRTAFVLAGGGTKGAFEVGALAHLVGTAEVVPDIVTSTSAGSILGVVLAQARGGGELAASVEDLRTDLLAMTRTELVFGRQPWLQAFEGTPFGDAVAGFIADRTRPPVPGGHPDPDRVVPAGAGTRQHHSWRSFTALASELPAAARARKALDRHSGSILTLEPLEAALRGQADVGIRPVDTARVARDGLELRMAVTALGAGATHYVCGDGTVVGTDARTPLGYSAVDAVEGALASSTVPMVFEPRPIGPEVYVDGGCLQNIPLEAAVTLGADDLYAVAACPLDPPPSEADFTAMNFVGIYMRTSSEIGFFETQRRNLAVPLPDGARLQVIAPTVDVVGPFEVQQGLMLLDLDYGTMRAEESLAELDEATRARAREATDSIVVARERAWYVEEACIADASVSATRSDVLQRLRSQVASALSARHDCGLVTPAGAEQWAAGPEHHADSVPDALARRLA